MKLRRKMSMLKSNKLSINCLISWTALQTNRTAKPDNIFFAKEFFLRDLFGELSGVNSNLFIANKQDMMHFHPLFFSISLHGQTNSRLVRFCFPSQGAQPGGATIVGWPKYNQTLSNPLQWSTDIVTPRFAWKMPMSWTRRFEVV